MMTTDTETQEQGQASAETQPPESAALTPDAAKAQIAEFTNDAAWMSEYFAGDRPKAEKMAQLFHVAYPEPGEPGAPQDNGAAADAGEAWLAPPKHPQDYDFSSLQTEAPDASEQTLQAEIKQSLHDEGVPAAAVNVATQVMAHRLRDGVPDDAAMERIKFESKAWLELRHGGAYKEIIRNAAKMFDRLEQRDPRIADLLLISGAVNDAWMIDTLAQLWTAKYSKAGHA